mgnify:CR=1 FL=1
MAVASELPVIYNDAIDLCYRRKLFSSIDVIHNPDAKITHLKFLINFMQSLIAKSLDENKSVAGRQVATTNLLKRVIESILENEECPERDSCLLDFLVDCNQDVN